MTWTNYIKFRIDKIQYNNKYGLSGERNETIKYTIELSKLTEEEYKSKNNR